MLQTWLSRLARRHASGPADSEAADRLIGATIDRHVRAWEKPSDHVPVVIDLAIERALKHDAIHETLHGAVVDAHVRLPFHVDAVSHAVP